ncbi:hypothetical protein [Kibdelosporangium phytohabitans]|uniref:Uncharacterized protein n=1 Tax=Kibdelosporangium phytohabitans TaxID=860235 RepID=A0A0N9HQ82_9PSEU|nr:hypothetical protein [Kibdelosporangium phytohabitans]ALG06846.1 hypothetical protein AOZ06_07795 [Kibdelosporangium phytohabitans]MBE1468093.1 hypothetical protein [Kibdelosporangium phytohabitans]
MSRRFECVRFPEGVAHIRTESGNLVEFRDGFADVDDDGLADELLAVPEVFGVTELDYGDRSKEPEQNGDNDPADDPADDSADDADASDEDTGDSSDAEGSGDGRPVVRAPKEEWVAYAVGQGLSQDEAEAMSKQELIDLLKG